MTAVYAKANHPSYAHMVTEAVKEIKDRKGCSRAAICNFVTKKYQLESSHRVNQLVSKSIVSAVESGTLVRKTGAGANGRFFSNNKNSKGSGDNKNVTSKPKKSPAKKLKLVAKFPTRTSGVNVPKAKNASAKKTIGKSPKSVSKDGKVSKAKTSKTASASKNVDSASKKSSSASKKSNSVKKSVTKKVVTKQASLKKVAAASKPKKASKKENAAAQV